MTIYLVEYWDWDIHVVHHTAFVSKKKAEDKMTALSSASGEQWEVNEIELDEVEDA